MIVANNTETVIKSLDNIKVNNPTTKTWSYALNYSLTGTVVLFACRWIGGKKGYGKRKLDKIPVVVFDDWDVARQITAEAIPEGFSDTGPGTKVVKTGSVIDRANQILESYRQTA